MPSDATAGNTRIRITKTYTDSTSPAIVDPCAIAFNAFGQGVQNGYGQAIDFTLNISSLSINEFDTNALSISPTSVKDFLNIAYNSEINSVRIINLIGQEVISQQTTSSHIQLNLTELARGIYVVNLNTTTGKHNFKILKQ